MHGRYLHKAAAGSFLPESLDWKYWWRSHKFTIADVRLEVKTFLLSFAWQDGAI